jgi:hypothetical protein
VHKAESLNPQSVFAVINMHARPRKINRAIGSAIAQGRFVDEVIICEDNDE